MSKKPYKSEEMQEHEKKIKKQNKILFILLILFFIPPLCLFPAYPKTYWQYNIYEYITKNMLITVGTKGPLPFFTILSSIYLTAFSFLLGCYICLIYIRKYGLKKEFQQKFYSLFFQAEFSSIPVDFSVLALFSKALSLSLYSELLVFASAHCLL